MTDDAQKTVLLRYLQEGRDALLWKLDGLSEYGVRRPLVPTGTNLLGLVKHVASTEAGYLGDVFGRPFPEPLPWLYDDAEPNADMWATADESRQDIVELYRRVWASSDATVAALGLDAPATVAWWPAERRETTFGHLLVRCVAETAQHAGHADILREGLDGQGGRDHDDVGDAGTWSAYVARIQQAADEHR